MSDQAVGGTASKSNFKILTMTILLVTVAIMSLKVYYREPDQRAAEICYPIYKMYKIAWVNVFSLVFYDDPVSHISHAIQTKNFYSSCVIKLDSISYLKKF